MALTDTKIRKLRTTCKTQILRDSPGLYLHITGGDPDKRVKRAAWVCRFTRNARTRKSTIGHWPEITVERARRERDRLTGQNTDIGVTVAEAVNDYRRGLPTVYGDYLASK